MVLFVYNVMSILLHGVETKGDTTRKGVGTCNCACLCSSFLHVYSFHI